MTEWSVVYLEPVSAEVEAMVRSRLPDRFALRVRRAGEPVAEALSEADFALVATTPIAARDLVGASRLRLIQHQGVGHDKTDLAAAAERGIRVALCPEGTSIGVAEHVFLLCLALYKRLLVADAATRRGEWLQWDLRPSSYELAGKTMGLLGLGRIGREVAVRARAFGAHVLYHDLIRVPPADEKALGVRWVPFDDLLSGSDILSLHVPLTAETRHVIGAAALGRMKRAALLINTARGGLVDETALVAALEAGWIGGAGLDVFEVEPPPPEHPLLKLPNVVVTPHIAAGTADALVTKMESCFANMLRVTAGESPRNVATCTQRGKA